MTNSERFPFNDIHPTALIAPGTIIGRGNTIGPYCIIGFPAEFKGKEKLSRGVIIGNNNTITGLVTIDSGTERVTEVRERCYIMKHAHIGHDAIIMSDVTISCGAKIGGHCVIIDGCNIGLNAVIHQHQDIAGCCMIGMGAVVTKRLITEPFKIYAGNPAKLIGENTKHPEYPIDKKETKGETSICKSNGNSICKSNGNYNTGIL
jgi:UDP-N-acetylglucosamine acyltransferase